jgi:hypothetical protein
MKHFQNDPTHPPLYRFLKYFGQPLQICDTARRHRIRAQIQNVADRRIERGPRCTRSFDLCDAAAT